MNAGESLSQSASAVWGSLSTECGSSMPDGSTFFAAENYS